MKAEYDFFQGERGKFYYPDAKFHLPIIANNQMSSLVLELQRDALDDGSKSLMQNR